VNQLKFSDIKSFIIQIFTSRDVQLTIALFGIGFLLTVTSTYPTLEERIEEDTIPAEENKRIEARLPLPYDELAHDDSLLEEYTGWGIGGHQGLKNASLELRSNQEDTNANVTLLKEEFEGEHGLIKEIRRWEMKNGEIEDLNDNTINMSEYYQIDYIDFNVTRGELSYTYTVRYYTQSYSILSLPGYVLMIVSIIFFLKAFGSVGPIGLDKEAKEKKRENQKVISRMLEDRKKK